MENILLSSALLSCCGPRFKFITRLRHQTGSSCVEYGRTLFASTSAQTMGHKAFNISKLLCDKTNKTMRVPSED